MVTKTQRKISLQIYFFAFLAAIAVFGIGIYVGMQLQKGIIEELSVKIEELKQKISSVETLLLFEENFCDIFADEIDKFHSETYEIGKKIEYMEKIEIDPKLKAEYMLLEFRDYVLVTKVNERCAKNYSTVLYFLDSKNCSVCWTQSEELTKARQMKERLFVYTFDGAINSSVVNALLKKFSINEYPSLIINGKKYVGLVNADTIISVE